MSEQVGEKIKDARIKQGLTQGQMANHLKITSRQYGKYEAGSFPKFKTNTIKNIDRILGTNVYAEIYEQQVPRGSLQDIIVNLSQSSKDHASASKDHASASLLRERNYERILNILEKKFNFGADEQTGEGEPPISADLQELLVDFGIRLNKWKSKKEGALALNRLFYGTVERKKSADTQSDSDK